MCLHGRGGGTPLGSCPAHGVHNLPASLQHEPSLQARPQPPTHSHARAVKLAGGVVAVQGQRGLVNAVQPAAAGLQAGDEPSSRPEQERRPASSRKPCAQRPALPPSPSPPGRSGVDAGHVGGQLNGEGGHVVDDGGAVALKVGHHAAQRLAHGQQVGLAGRGASGGRPLVCIVRAGACPAPSCRAALPTPPQHQHAAQPPRTSLSTATVWNGKATGAAGSSTACGAAGHGWSAERRSTLALLHMPLAPAWPTHLRAGGGLVHDAQAVETGGGVAGAQLGAQPAQLIVGHVGLRVRAGQQRTQGRGGRDGRLMQPVQPTQSCQPITTPQRLRPAHLEAPAGGRKRVWR